MNRVEILEQIKKFGYRAESLPDSRIQISICKDPMTEAEAIAWIEQQSLFQCPECGKFRGRKK